MIKKVIVAALSLSLIVPAFVSAEVRDNTVMPSFAVQKYDSSAQYEPGDFVEYGGCLYKCVVTNGGGGTILSGS